MSAAPLASLHVANRSRAVELARRRYFEEGLPPGGAIQDAIFQSWARCQRLHETPDRRVEFQPVTAGRKQLALQRNRLLHEAWSQELPHMQMLLGATSCAAMLIDGTGVLIGATCTGRPHEQLMPVATRLGVDLSEEAVGTTAPGVVVRTGQPVCVLGSEHFFDDVRAMHCAAAPIRDTQGCMAGVLDLSSEAIAFNFDAAAVVSHLACAIENRLLVTQARDQLVLRIQVDPTLLHSAMAGLVGISMEGDIAWANGVASKLLGLAPIDRNAERPSAEAVLGRGFGPLASMPRQGAGVLALPNGLTLWASTELRSLDGVQGVIQLGAWEPRHSAAAPEAVRQLAPPALPADLLQAAEPMASAVELLAAASTVKTTHRDLLHKTMQDCGGNVSLAARKLGVSRGWIYRRMKADDHQPFTLPR